MEETKIAYCNRIEHIDIQYDNPTLKIKSNLNNLTLFTGTNGSGKSMFLKHGFFLGQVMFSYNVIKIHLSQEIDKESIQFILDNTFENPNFTGTCELKYTCGSYIKVKLNEGKVEDYFVHLDGIPILSGKFSYLSTNMRLFNNIILYLKYRKQFTINPLLTDHLLKNLVKFYKLYDIYFVEGLINGIHKINYEVLNNQLKKLLQERHKNVISISINLEKCEIILKYEDNTENNILKLSNGDQAIINMLIGSQL